MRLGNPLERFRPELANEVMIGPLLCIMHSSLLSITRFSIVLKVALMINFSNLSHRDYFHCFAYYVSIFINLACSGDK